jgi:hypothetical protein
MHKCRRAKRAYGVSIGLVSHINHIILNKCIYIYLYWACISGWCRIWDIGITFYCCARKHTSGGKKQKKKRKCSKKWIIPWGYSSHIFSDICTTRLKCQCLPLDNCMFNSAWLYSPSFLLCIPLIGLSLVIVACISYTAC